MANDSLSVQYESLSVGANTPHSQHPQAHPIPTSSGGGRCFSTEPLGGRSDTGVPDVEVSTPARNATGLLDLPAEILRVIYAFVLKQYDESDADRLKVASPYYALGPYEQNIDGDSHMPFYTDLSLHAKHLGLEKGTLSLLLVCSQIYQEAAPVLYSSYEFHSISAESFRCCFIKQIGMSNTKSNYLGRYWRMIEQQMPELQEFRVTTQIDRWRWPVTYEPHNIWIGSHRGLLWVAAWVTRNHKVLKYAVWNESDTVVDGKLDDEVYIKSHWDDRPTVLVEVNVTKDKPSFLQNAEHPEAIEKRNVLLFPGAETESILLDCFKIRRTGFVGLSTSTTCRPYDYQMDITIPNVTSESSKPAELSEEVQIAELFLHNKNPEVIFNHVSSISHPRLRTYYMKAPALEAANIEKEMLMKDGPPLPPLTPFVPADDEEDDGWDGPDDGNNGGWGGPGSSQGDNTPSDEDGSSNSNGPHGYATDNDDDYEDDEGSEWSG